MLVEVTNTHKAEIFCAKRWALGIRFDRASCRANEEARMRALLVAAAKDKERHRRSHLDFELMFEHF